MKKPLLHGIVSLLPDQHYEQVKQIWQALEDECGIPVVETMPFPHFSWLIGTGFDWQALEYAIEEIASDTAPIAISTNGIGVFSGINPVIYMPLARNDQLNALHHRIWDAVQLIGVNLSPYYAPENWIPHISLAVQGVNPETISCAMKKLAFDPLRWQFDVDNISFIRRTDEVPEEVHYRFNFQSE
jgi:2'-5' RNA ligase